MQATTEGLIPQARLAILLVCAVLLLRCGGGGGNEQGTESVSLSANPASVTLDIVQRNSEIATLLIRISANLPRGTVAYVGVHDSANLIANLVSTTLTDGTGVILTLQVRSDLPVGVQRGELAIAVCRDPVCNARFDGGLLSVPLVLNVFPNIDAPASIFLSRTGAETPPSAVVPISVPAAAGNVEVKFMSGNVGTVRLEGANLVIDTHPKRAGIYEDSVSIRGWSSRYQAYVPVRYEILPPPGGERDWSLAGEQSFTLSQGSRTTSVLTVEPPTWVAEPITFEVPASEPWIAVRRLDSTRYEMALDASNARIGSVNSTTVFFHAGQFARILGVPIRLAVDPAFEVLGSFDLVIDRNTTASDLSRSAVVRMVQPPDQQWSVASNAAWLKPRAPSGRTGSDPLLVDIEPAFIEPSLLGSFRYSTVVPRLTVGIDRIGTAPIDIAPTVTLNLNRLQHVAPAQLTAGSGGRIYVVGDFLPSVLDPGVLNVSGARVVNRSLIDDMSIRIAPSRFLVRIDVEDLVADIPVTIELNEGLASRSVTIPVLERVSLAAPDLPLTPAPRYSPVYSPRSRTLFWQEDAGRVRSAQYINGTWVQRSTDLADLLGFDLSVDERRLVALAPTKLIELDAQSLSTLGESDVRDGWIQQLWGTQSFRPVVIGVEDRPWAWVQVALSTNSAQMHRLIPNGPGQWSTLSMPYFRSAENLANVKMGFLRSVDRAAVRQVVDEGTRFKIDGHFPGDFGYFRGVFQSHSGARPVALARNGRVIDDQGGVLEATGEFSPSLTAALPVGRTPRAFAISADGRLAYAYVSRLVSGNNGITESEPALIVAELVGSGNALTARVLQETALSQPINCRSPATQSECENPAHLILDPDGREVLLLGRDALTVVPVPGLALASARMNRTPRILPVPLR